MGTFFPFSMEEIPNNHLGCTKPCKYWDKLPTSTGERRISEASTVPFFVDKNHYLTLVAPSHRRGKVNWWWTAKNSEELTSWHQLPIWFHPLSVVTSCWDWGVVIPQTHRSVTSHFTTFSAIPPNLRPRILKGLAKGLVSCRKAGKFSNNIQQHPLYLSRAPPRHFFVIIWFRDLMNFNLS